MSVPVEVASLQRMGIFKAPATWTDRAQALPAERSTWVITLGMVGIAAAKDVQVVDDAVAEIESSGWTLVHLVSTQATGLGGQTQNAMTGHFRRA